MTKKSKAVISAIVIFALASASLIAHLWIIGIRFDEPVALIYRNGELLYEIELLQVSEPISYNIENVSKVEIRDGKIGISQANCRDQICVNMGFVNGVVPIICLPERIEIRVRNNDSDIDGVTY
ncbi:MAG: NusG domain II-containing protein [Oscillospiraceae bacterium]|nr:NusG domain II-containing protein [Oscillospiraceae bacterium]